MIAFVTHCGTQFLFLLSSAKRLVVPFYQAIPCVAAGNSHNAGRGAQYQLLPFIIASLHTRQ